MEAIGGYFELPDFEKGEFPYNDGILLNTGRNSLEYILRCIGNIKGIYLPYYTCEVVLEPLKKLKIPWHFYHINSRFEIDDEIKLKDAEYIIANNYYGIKDYYLQTLSKIYGDRLIIDCAQAFFAKPISGIKTFYSPRKYIGVADGGVAYLGDIQDGGVQVKEIECTQDHNNHLLKRKQFGAEVGFADFQENEKKLDNQPIRWMSDSTRDILNHIDYKKVVSKRRENFMFIHDALARINNITLPDIDSFACPMVYPFIGGQNMDLRMELIHNKVFVAKYWPNVYKIETYETEYELSKRLIPIPCDHRYGNIEMDSIIYIVKRFCE